MSFKRQIPNMLTLLRILIVPVYLICLYVVKGSKGADLALFFFLLAGITDFFDGHLARKLKSISDFGKVADPLADKIIVSVALITIAIYPMNFISIVVVVIIIFREILVTLLRSWYQKRDIYVSANIWGKLKTCLQMTGIIAALIFNSFRHRFAFLSENEDSFILAIQIFFWLVLVVTIVSGVTYLPFLNKYKREKNNNRDRK